jgi:hypothetical protein
VVITHISKTSEVFALQGIRLAGAMIAQYQKLVDIA